MNSADGKLSGLIEVGYVARAHGVQGEVLLRRHWTESDALELHRELMLAKAADRLSTRIVSSRETPKGLLCHLDGIVGREQAERWVGATCWTARDELEPGEYYLSDLVGATIQCDGRVVGVGERVASYPTMDTVLIRCEGDEILEQPLLDHWVERFDADARILYLRSLEGVIQ